MKKYLYSVLCILYSLSVSAIETVESPSLNMKAYFDVRDGRPVYWLLHKGDTVIRPSYLGISLRGEHSRGNFNDYKEEQTIETRRSSGGYFGDGGASDEEHWF